MKKIDKNKPEGKSGGPIYSAPALEKGLDIIEMLCRSEKPLSQKEIAKNLGRSVGEIYRMLSCLVNRNYVVYSEDNYHITTKIFELGHVNPPTHRLLAEAQPIMQRLSNEIEQSCHLTVYNQGCQVVIAKLDSPSGMGFSMRVGAEVDVLVSASGRVLLAFQDPETIKLRIAECLQRCPDHADIDVERILKDVQARGFESFPSAQVRGLHAVAYPILGTRGYSVAALTVPYAERVDRKRVVTIPEVEAALGIAAQTLSARIGGYPQE